MKIGYKQDNIETLISTLKRVAINLNEISDKLSSSFGNIEIVADGIDKIRNNIEVIEQRVTNTSSIISKQNDFFKEGELKITHLYESIRIPNELGNVYSPFDIEHNDIKIFKNDGKEISTDSIDEQELVLENNVYNQKTLYDLTDKQEKQFEFTDEYSENQEILSNISNDNESKEKELNEYKETQNIKVKDMKNDSNIDKKKLDDYHESSYKKLAAMNSTEEEKQEPNVMNILKYNEGQVLSNNNKNVELKNMKDNSNMDEKELEDYHESSYKKLAAMNSTEEEKQEPNVMNILNYYEDQVLIKNKDENVDLYNSYNKIATISNATQPFEISNMNIKDSDISNLDKEHLEDYLNNISLKTK